MNLSPVTVGLGHFDSVNALSFSDRMLASGGEDGNIYLWSLSRSSYPILSAPRGEPCSSLKFCSQKPNTLYSSHGNCIFSWDIRNMNTPLNYWNFNDDEINSIDLLNGEPRLLSADESGTIQIVDTDTGSVVRTLRKHDNICSSAKFRPNRSWQLISGGLDCRVIVSDWKGSGLGVIIFEMNEIVENIDDDSQANVAYLRYVEESNCSNEDERDYETFSETDEDSDTNSRVVEAVTADNVSLEVSSGLGSEIISNELNTNYNLPNDGQSSNIDLTSSTNVSESTFVSSAYGNWQSGIPVNPPMVHVISCSTSGDFVAAGLESSTIELFSGDGKRLSHLESIYGHNRGVSALHFLNDQFLISGGNDRKLFVWTLGQVTIGHQIVYSKKISAFEGIELDNVFVADCSSIIQVFDLTDR